MKALAIVICMSFLPLACQKSEPPAPLPVSSAPVTSVAPVASVAPAATASVATADSAAVDPSLNLAAAPPAGAPATAAKVPTPSDYEVSAEATITPTNAASVLAAIEKQVGQ
jgi:hypothetical protein